MPAASGDVSVEGAVPAVAEASDGKGGAEAVLGGRGWRDSIRYTLEQQVALLHSPVGGGKEAMMTTQSNKK